jgi:hypothetical protein
MLYYQHIIIIIKTVVTMIIEIVVVVVAVKIKIYYSPYRDSSQLSAASPALRLVPAPLRAGLAIRPGARCDILLALPTGISIADVSVTHPPSISTLSAASATPGAAAARRDQQKRVAYWRVETSQVPLYPLFCGDLWASRPAGDGVQKLGEEAAGAGGVSRAPS